MVRPCGGRRRVLGNARADETAARDQPTLVTGLRIRRRSATGGILCIVGDFKRECVVIEVDTSLSGVHVVREIERLTVACDDDESDRKR
jgi:hypothetical protein